MKRSISNTPSFDIKPSRSELEASPESRVSQSEINDADQPPAKKRKPSTKCQPATEMKDDKPNKTRWTPAEDAILINLLHQLIDQHLWDAVKAEGSLVARTGYGARYHAKMLLRQGASTAGKK